MQPAYQSVTESGGASSSGEDLHRGLIYTPAYYEEEQVYCDILEPSNQCSKRNSSPFVNPPVEINEHSATSIDLPPISWHGYNSVPKILSLTNTGKTILINGQWVKGRPYIEGGPLNGTYIFSQIHFHSPSEHEIDGKRYPLEMHVVHYKTSYLTQERAMLERDGTVVLVYLFQVLDTTQTDFSSVTKLATQIEKVNSRTETKDVSLEQIVKPFTSNYYVYWGSVETGKQSYLLQWIVNGGIVYVTKQEADELLAIMNLAEINVKSIPRMKPENNAIFYVEEVEKEDKDDKQGHDCNACCSYQDDSSCNFQYCVCKKGDECRSQPVFYCKKNLFTRKNYSGLRLCCHKVRKPIRKITREAIPVTMCCTKEGKVCVCPDPEPEENCSENQVVATTEATASCPSVNTFAPLPECTEEPTCEEPKETVQVKVVSSCPSVNNSSKECKEEIEVKIKKKKKTSPCKDACKEKNKKNQKKEDCEASCPKKSSSAKKEKKSSPKRSKKSDTECDVSKSSSKASTSTKKSKKRESSTDSQNFCKEREVDCYMSTLTEKSFDEMLREYETTWLDDSSLKMSTKAESDDCDKSIVNVPIKKKSRGENTIRTLYEKKREPKVSERPAEDCTVDFLLKPNAHKSNPSSSYMSPKSISEELKCFENKVSNKGVNVPDVTVNTVTFSGVRIPTENPNELPKEFCVQVELLFHANNKDFTECVTQEYNLALMYNQNILQEYRGILCPKNLQIGNYEKLELVPKYPELDNISIRLQDCTVKMESSDQICMRAKFLMKELNFKNLDRFGEQEGEEHTDKKILALSDAVTQCSTKEFDDKLTNFDILEKICLQAKVSELPEKSFPEVLLPTSVSFTTTESQLPKQSLEQGKLKNEIFENKKSEVPEKPGENTLIDEGKVSEQPSSSEKESQKGNKTTNSTEGNINQLNSLLEACKKAISFEEILQEDREGGEKKEDEGRKESKELTKKAVKELKNLFSNRKKTVYFMYEKVEKDENSGKKVFIGSFRSKDDAKNLPREEKSIQNIDNEEEKKLLFLSVKDSVGSYDLMPILDSNERVLKIDSPCQSKNLINDKKDLITLHKLKAKHLGVHESKKGRLSFVVGKSLNQLQRNSKNFKRLAELVGIDKKENSKISVYELQESTENEICEKPTLITEETDSNLEREGSFLVMSRKHSSKNMRRKTPTAESVEARKVFDTYPTNGSSITFVSDMTSSKNLKEKPYIGASATTSATEPVEGRKTLTKKGSQSAVIIIPVEVESLSKVEVILVEHSDSTKKTVLKRGREITPCFDP